jgi:hypothetical protein
MQNQWGKVLILACRVFPYGRKVFPYGEDRRWEAADMGRTGRERSDGGPWERARILMARFTKPYLPSLDGRGRRGG